MGRMAPIVKAFELRKKSKADLETQLEEYKNELAQLRVAKVTGGAPSKLAKIRVVRKQIARVLTVYNQAQKEALRKKFKDAKCRKLIPRMTARQTKRALNFPQRVYAVKA